MIFCFEPFLCLCFNTCFVCFPHTCKHPAAVAGPECGRSASGVHGLAAHVATIRFAVNASTSFDTVSPFISSCMMCVCVCVFQIYYSVVSLLALGLVPAVGLLTTI